MDEPLTEEGHENRAERIQDHKHNGHDDAVSEQDVAGNTCVVVVVSDGAAIVAAVVATARARAGRVARKGVAIVADCSLREVDVEACRGVVLGDGGIYACRVDGAALVPGGDPGGAVAAEVKGL